MSSRPAADFETGAGTAPDLVCDFVGGALGHRLRSGHGRRDPLARAVGLRRGERPTVVDATAGLGRDAFLLASLGLEVILIERSPVVYAALRSGLDRAADAGAGYAAAVARMDLRFGDARTLLAELSPDVVLIDPMHPDRTKSALVKREMRDLRALVGADQDAPELLRAALTTATRRVVLKWPLRAAPMMGMPAPSHQLLGKTVRYDVFMAR